MYGVENLVFHLYYLYKVSMSDLFFYQKLDFQEKLLRRVI